MSVKIYHNPKCSKSRAALKLIEERGIEPRIVPYLVTPPTADELAALLGMLGIGARDLLRTGEPAYSALDLARPDLPERTLIEAMALHPILIERPIVVSGKRAVIGRPPERVLEIL